MLGQLLLSLKVMVLGLAAVFLGLVLLIIFVQLMHKVVNINKKKDINQSSVLDNSKTENPKTDNVQETKVTADNDGLSDEDDELIAVISAAVAAALNRSTHDIIVRSLKRIEPHSPVWNRVSRQEQIGTRL